MKKISLIIVIVLMLVSFAFGEQKTDVNKENFYTHNKRILQIVRTTPIEKTLSNKAALFDVINLLKRFTYELDELDHLQTIEETEQRKIGDCEDFTLYVLWGLRKNGVSLEDLGMYIFGSEKVSMAHIVPIIKIGRVWFIVETEGNFMAIPLFNYLDYVYRAYENNNGSMNGFVEIFFRGLGNDGKSIVRYYSNNYDPETFVGTIEEYMKICEEIIIERGWAKE